jgi:hypothetical protein
VAGTIQGGTLTETGGAELVINPTGIFPQIGMLDGVTVDGNLDLSQFSSAYVDVKDGLTLNGTAFVGDGSGATDGGFDFLGVQTLSGNGTVIFGKSSGNFLTAEFSSGPTALTIGPGITIRGSSGMIGQFASAPIVNEGKIIADDSGGAIGSFVYDTDFSGGYTEFRSALIDTSGVTNPAPQTVYQTERTGGFCRTGRQRGGPEADERDHQRHAGADELRHLCHSRSDVQSSRRDVCSNSQQQPPDRH